MRRSLPIRRLVTAALFAAAGCAGGSRPHDRPLGPEPLRALFVGNSFTFGHDLPGLVVELGAARDPPLRIEVGMVARDGMTLERHWKEGEAARRLTNEHWDVVVLQEQSTRPLVQPELTEAYARRLATVARESGAEVVLFETWGRVDQPETAVPRAAAYRRIAQSVGASVAPVGTAWKRSRLERPDLRLHADDGLHANPAGARLAASVILEALLRTRPQVRRAQRRRNASVAVSMRRR